MSRSWKESIRTRPAPNRITRPKSGDVRHPAGSKFPTQTERRLAGTSGEAVNGWNRFYAHSAPGSAGGSPHRVTFLRQFNPRLCRGMTRRHTNCGNAGAVWQNPAWAVPTWTRGSGFFSALCEFAINNRIPLSLIQSYRQLDGQSTSRALAAAQRQGLFAAALRAVQRDFREVANQVVPTSAAVESSQNYQRQRTT